MKKFLLMFMVFLTFAVIPIMAQDGGGGDISIGTGTFAGITALVSMIVTQIAKQIAVVANNNWLKIIISVVVGLLVVVGSKLLNLPSEILDGTSWAQALLVGALAGLSGSGFYDLIKAFISKKED